MKVRDLVKLLKERGWVKVREGKGDHAVYAHPDFSEPISIDGRPGHEIPAGTLHAYLRKAGLK